MFVNTQLVDENIVSIVFARKNHALAKFTKPSSFMAGLKAGDLAKTVRHHA